MKNPVDLYFPQNADRKTKIVSEDKEAGESTRQEVVTNSFRWPVICDIELLFQIRAIV